MGVFFVVVSDLDKRFINEDSYSGTLTNPLSQNLYTYVHNNPLIYTDPNGDKAHFIGASWLWPAKAEKQVKQTPKEVNRFCVWFGCQDIVDGLSMMGPEFAWMQSINIFKAGYGFATIEAWQANRTGAWALTPFARGVQIEKTLGGMNNAFPVIDKFINGSNGVAASVTSIKSLDFTLSSFQTETQIYKTIMGYAEKLSGFNSTTWNNITVNVNSSTVKILEVALPPVKQTATQAQQFTNALNDAAKKGIKIIYTIVE